MVVLQLIKSLHGNLAFCFLPYKMISKATKPFSMSFLNY